MRKHYDFSNAKRNPYARRLKQQVTIRLDRDQRYSPGAGTRRHAFEQRAFPGVAVDGGKDSEGNREALANFEAVIREWTGTVSSKLEPQAGKGGALSAPPPVKTVTP